jgi:hypothetical protein
LASWCHLRVKAFADRRLLDQPIDVRPARPVPLLRDVRDNSGYKPLPTAAQLVWAPGYSKPAPGVSGVLGSSSRQVPTSLTLPASLVQGANGVSAIFSCKLAVLGCGWRGCCQCRCWRAGERASSSCRDFTLLQKLMRVEALRRRRLELKTTAPGSELARKHTNASELHRLRQGRRRYRTSVSVFLQTI